MADPAQQETSVRYLGEHSLKAIVSSLGYSKYFAELAGISSQIVEIQSDIKTANADIQTANGNIQAARREIQTAVTDIQDTKDAAIGVINSTVEAAEGIIDNKVTAASTVLAEKTAEFSAQVEHAAQEAIEAATSYEGRISSLETLCAGTDRTFTYGELFTMVVKRELKPGFNYILTDYTPTVGSSNARVASTPVRYTMSLYAITPNQFDPRVTIVSAIKGDEDISQKNLVNTWEVWYDFNGGYGVPDAGGNYPNTNSIYRLVDGIGSTMKGCIYKMIDQNGNECDYDFKNILFKYSHAHNTDLNFIEENYGGVWAIYGHNETGWCYTFTNRLGDNAEPGVDTSLYYLTADGHPYSHHNKIIIGNASDIHISYGNICAGACANNTIIGTQGNLIVSYDGVEIYDVIGGGYVSYNIVGSSRVSNTRSSQGAIRIMQNTNNHGQSGFNTILDCVNVYIGPMGGGSRFKDCTHITVDGNTGDNGMFINLVGSSNVHFESGSEVGWVDDNAAILNGCTFKSGASYHITNAATTAANNPLRNCTFHGNGISQEWTLTDDIVADKSPKDVWVTD